MVKTNKDLTIKKGCYSCIPGAEVFVPAGSEVNYSERCKCYFVNPSIFTGIDKHDAEYHGFRVNIEDIKSE